MWKRFVGHRIGGIMEFYQNEIINKDMTRVALGTWSIGGWLWGGSDVKAAEETILKSLEMGINTIDTAPVYGFGLSEELVGKVVKEFGNRDKLIIATKCGLDWKDGKVFRNSSKERIFKEIKDSLRRLQVDYIDIYQVHWPDDNVPYEETAEAMLKLYEEGKILQIGTSNYNVEQMKRFKSSAPLHSNQPPYNMFEREIRTDILPFCKDNGIMTLAYGAICRGLLSGKMEKDRKFVGDDIRIKDPKFNSPKFEQYLDIVKKLDNYAMEHFGKNVLALAIRWILDKGVEIALWGARKPEQLEPLNDIFGWKLSEEDFKEIEKILEKVK